MSMVPSINQYSRRTNQTVISEQPLQIFGQCRRLQIVRARKLFRAGAFEQFAQQLFGKRFLHAIFPSFSSAGAGLRAGGRFIVQPFARSLPIGKCRIAHNCTPRKCVRLHVRDCVVGFFFGEFLAVFGSELIIDALLRHMHHVGIALRLCQGEFIFPRDLRFGRLQ